MWLTIITLMSFLRGYEARYSMGHYLLDRFIENLDAAPLDASHMAQLEQINLVEQLGQPHFRDILQQMQHIARNAYEPPINPITEDDVVGALYQRGKQIMAACAEQAEQKDSDLGGKLSDTFHETLNRMVHEVAGTAAGMHETINPNDLLRCIWHVVDDAYRAHQHGYAAEQFYEECNVETPYFQQMLGFARGQPPIYVPVLS
jgi:hypothetical protein